MPSALRLPDSLASLTRIHAARLTHERYGPDVRGLIDVIRETRAEAKSGTGQGKELARSAVAELAEAKPSIIRKFLTTPKAESAASEAPTKPDWASAMGRDNYGQWTEISVGAARQKLRWIAPGRFLMGSPATEAKRWDSEGPQHEVTISKGFWLFDTACTQALWHAVMGNNPSAFQGAVRPVETVSWNEAQDFIVKINKLVAGLNLSLPSEAQWEYACRAGTTTPFSFGEDITPQQVNYDGNYPYRDGSKGLYRRETVAVGSLPANPGGLYETHGNVWEWCADAWHESYAGAPSDGSVWDDAQAAGRVLRGGSWFDEAQDVRSANRFARAPDVRYNSIGFRCARVQE